MDCTYLTTATGKGEGIGGMVEWQCHIQMLFKEFSLLDDNDWSECPKDTNAVERKNRDSKMTNTASLRSLLIALYKSDKSCAYHTHSERHAY